MEHPEKPPLPERNPLTHAAHRAEVLRQITLPLLIVLLVIFAAAAGVIWAGVEGSGEMSRWADVSLMWLLLPAILLALLLLALLAGMVYGIVKLLQILPGYARLVQDFFLSVQKRMRNLSDKAVEPLLTLQSLSAGLRALRRKPKGSAADRLPPV